MKIAILGTRGVPPNYGGFETFAAELSTRLVQRGHEVFVYCRDVDGSVDPSSGRHPERQSRDLGAPGGASQKRWSGEDRARGESFKTAFANRPPRTAGLTWNGVHRIVLPSVGHKYLETVSHAFLSALDALRRDFDAVLVCNAANAFVLPLLRAARIPCAINVDGVERKRRKWNILGQAVYAIGETFSVAFASRVIADAEVIARYYRQHYAFEPAIIPYGCDFPVEEDSDVLERLGLRRRNYVLYVSRFEPENNPLEVVLAYERAGRGPQLGGDASAAASGSRALDSAPERSGLRAARSLPPLVMLGKGLYAADLVRELHGHASDRVLFPGALYGRDYRTLQRHALIYVQATEVGGTHPALIEAMGSGGAVLAHDTPENREVGGDAVGYFRLRPLETLSGMLREWLAGEEMRETMRGRARQRAAERFSWERVTDAYEELLQFD